MRGRGDRETRGQAELPVWLVEEVQDARRLLGVGDDWHVTVKVVDHPNGDENNDGSCSPDVTYLNAVMEFARDLEQDERGRFVVLHEVLHVAHAEIDQVVETALSGLSEEERGRMWDLYEAAMERSLQRMSRAMVRHIRPMEDGDQVIRNITDSEREIAQVFARKSGDVPSPLSEGEG